MPQRSSYNGRKDEETMLSGRLRNKNSLAQAIIPPTHPPIRPDSASHTIGPIREHICICVLIWVYVRTYGYMRGHMRICVGYA